MDSAKIFLPAVISDLVSLVLPGGSLAGTTLQFVLEKRATHARTILESELRRGEITLADLEPTEIAAIAYRFQRAALEGAAALNLRLLARLICGMASQGVLVADEFLYYADIVAGLRPEEIIVLAAFWRHTNSPEIAVLEDAERTGRAMDATENELVPTVFRSQAHYMAVLGALLRTGFLEASSGWGGMLIYQTTPLLDEMIALAPLDDLLKQEDDQAKS